MIRDSHSNSFLASLFSKRIKTINDRIIGYEEYIYPNNICIPGLRRLFVQVNGDFHPCEKVGNAFKIGNVNKGLDFSKIFELIDQYIDISKEDCCHCWAAKVCYMCFSSARKGAELSLDRKRAQCETVKNDFHEALQMYCEIMERNPNAFKQEPSLLESLLD